MNRLLEIYAQDSGVPIQRVAVLPVSGDFVGQLIIYDGSLWRWNGTEWVLQDNWLIDDSGNLILTESNDQISVNAGFNILVADDLILVDSDGAILRSV